MGTVQIFDSQVSAFKEDLARAYQERSAPVILQMMRVECPVDTGVLRQQHSIDKALRHVAGGFVIRFRAAPYWGVLVALGHGVIVPKRAKALRFVTKAGAVVFTRRVRAVAGNPWMYRALVRSGVRDVKLTIPPRIAGG